MEIKVYSVNGSNIAELISNEILINTSDEGNALLADLYYQDFDKIILHLKNIRVDFFDLGNGIAGDVLQTSSNFRLRLVFVGQPAKLEKQSLIDFIRESNRGRQVNFLLTVEAALEALSN